MNEDILRFIITIPHLIWKRWTCLFSFSRFPTSIRQKVVFTGCNQASKTTTAQQQTRQAPAAADLHVSTKSANEVLTTARIKNCIIRKHAHRNRPENIKKINEVKQSGVIAEMLSVDGSRLVAETWTGTWPTTTWGAWSRMVTVADYCINAEQTWEALYWFGVFVIAESWSDSSHCMDGVRNPKFNLVKSEFHVQTFAESLFKYPSLLVKHLLSFVLFFSCRT